MSGRKTAQPSDLPDAWRERAALLREWGAGDDVARVWEIAAEELDGALREYDDKPLNLQDAAAESGYSADHLGALVRQGKIPNAGRPNAPAILRKHLRRKPQSAAQNGRDNDRLNLIVNEIRSSKQE